MTKSCVKAVKLGLEAALEEPCRWFARRKIGLICNQASVNHEFEHAADLFHVNDQIELIALFGPQHGIRGDVQDNMVETGHGWDPATRLPVYSLYSETREPTAKMMENLDALVFDLQDVGCRVYTFIYTLANCMRACAKCGCKMIVLDRPNPITGNSVQGPVLEGGFESFVGMFPIPMRHGMTVGEIARYFNTEFEINCDLDVVQMDGWERNFYYDETDAPWVMPSPNMPTVDTAVVFPATVFFEGTAISEGRGTTRPFEIVGAPYVDADELARQLNSRGLSGVKFRPVNFLPTFQKHSGRVCGGVFVHVLDRDVFDPVNTGVTMVKTIYDLYRDDFQWKSGPYEYVYDKNPFDVISGTDKIRASIEKGKSLEELTVPWARDLTEFIDKRGAYLLY
jgi:uncharacterized protein YbbC (DUF1343 family)